MTRREIVWRLEMAAKKICRGAYQPPVSPVDRNPEFTEKEVKVLDTALDEARQRIAERFQGKAPQT
jgi:hypothetical protein